MRTYANNFGITKDADAEKYRSIRSLYFDTFCAYLSGEEDATMLKAISYTDAAQNYLASCGLTTDELTQLHSLIEK